METPEALVQHVSNMDQITAEMEQLLPSAPKNSEVGLESHRWLRTLAALQSHRQLNDAPITNIRNVIQASIDFVKVRVLRSLLHLREHVNG